MAAIGMLLLWASYTLCLYGVCLMRDYQITLLDLVVPGRYTGGWPPSLISGASSGSGGGSSGSSGSGSGDQPLNPPSNPTNPAPSSPNIPWWQQLLNAAPLSGSGNGTVTPV